MTDDPKSVLDRLDLEFDGLRREYDLFFSGGRKAEPGPERLAFENTVRRLGQRTFINTHDNFRFSTIQARYYSFSNHWVRTVRDMEEGRLSRDAKGRLSRPVPQPEDPIDSEHLDEAARRLSEARLSCGLPAGGEGGIAALKEALLSRAREIATRSGVHKIEFRIAVEEGKPKIRAILK